MTDTEPTSLSSRHLSALRRVAAVYIDFIIFNALWGILYWGVVQAVPALSEISPFIKFAVFVAAELMLLNIISWSPGNDLLGIHVRLMPGFVATSQPSLLRGDLAVDQRLAFKDRWWTVLFGVLALLNGLKTLVRWTQFTPPPLFFGMETSGAAGVALAVVSGLLECGVGIAALRVRPIVLPLAVVLYGTSVASAFVSWPLIPGWIERYTVARRAFQGTPVRPGEVEFMQQLGIWFVVWPVVFLLWSALVYYRARRPAAA